MSFIVCEDAVMLVDLVVVCGPNLLLSLVNLLSWVQVFLKDLLLIDSGIFENLTFKCFK